MEDVTEQAIELKTDDKKSLAATLFRPQTDSPNKVLVIGSALGVPRYFYSKFAHFFARNGYAVLTFDYIGIYESLDVGISGSEMKMEHWGVYDIEAALNYALTKLKAKKLIYIGHSCGAQLLSLAPSSKRVKRVIFVAGQLGYWKCWPWPYNVGMLLFWYLLLILTPLFDYLPTKLLGLSSVDLPSGVAKQWAQWGRTNRYLFNSIHKLDNSGYNKLSAPLLAYHFNDDFLFAPPESVDALLDKYSSARMEKKL